MGSKRASELPADDKLCVPLPCYGRDLEFIPLNNLPLFHCLKRQVKEHGYFTICPASSRRTPAEMPGEALPTPEPHSRRVPVVIAKHFPSSEEQLKRPDLEELIPAAIAPPRKPGITSYEKQRTETAQMGQQPMRGARRRTTLCKPPNRAAQVPLYTCQPAPSRDGAGIATAEEQLKAARVPKKDAIDYTHPSLFSWADSLKRKPCEPAGDAKDDDLCMLRQMMSFETRSICEEFSSHSGGSSSEESAGLPLEGGIIDGLANLELTKASGVLTGSRPKSGPETPLGGISQGLKSSATQEVVFDIDSVIGDNGEAEKDDMVKILFWPPRQRISCVNGVLKWLCQQTQYHAAIT